jgi:hypothetical protein
VHNPNTRRTKTTIREVIDFFKDRRAVETLSRAF